ncbi:MAG: O-antigen ligase family protein [Bryobacteraceae bacterium]|nr:O-antigen ligase family protein [Bryobacteraceae bacterium]
MVLPVEVHGFSRSIRRGALESQMPHSGRLVLILLLHLALGLAMHRLPPLATLHTFATVLAVLAISLSTRSPAVVLMCAAYVSGSEVLWRMSRSYTFHETAKYMISLLSVIGLVRLRRVRLPGAAMLYLALLLPAAVFTFYNFPLNQFRKTAMFNLSGPIAVTFCLMYCSNLRISIPELWRVVLAFVNPLCGVLAITVSSSYLHKVNFTTESNVQTSGGFGPNQVATSLALGALLLVLAVLLAQIPQKLRAALIALGTLMILQSSMTFSRGGVVASAAALLCALPFILTGHKYRRQILAGLALVCLLLLLAFPVLNAYTGGKLAERFAEKEMSGREGLALIDWMLFEENPWFGVGVGISSYFHPGRAAAHTEFTRAVAEHGLLGFFAYVCLAWLLIRRSASILLDPASRPLRGFLVALMAWPVLYMAVNAMRTSAPAFALGLAFLTILPADRRTGQAFSR